MTDLEKRLYGRPQVRLAQGLVIGIEEQGDFPGPIESFKGIPYAQPPVGPLRFRDPVRIPHDSNAIIDASKFGPRAPARQFIVIGPRLEESEDCLTVNIFRPSGTEAGSGLPVALYFHGGAFNRGNAAMHDTAAVVGWSESPMIGVSFGYRIGALGFLPSRASADMGLLNLGLKDQIVMMEWVQDNIEHFGGDPACVTLMGLSAGAHSIGHHLLNYDSDDQKPLFSGVIMESGAPTSRAVRYPDAAVHESQWLDLLKELKCPEGLSNADMFDYLRSLPISKIADAQASVFDKYNRTLQWAFQPVIDGEIIRRPPIDAWQSGKWHKVPILTGFTTNEGSLYVDKTMSSSAQFTNFWRTLLPMLDETDISTIDQLYPNPEQTRETKYKETRQELGVGNMYKRIEAAYAHYAYVAPVRQTAHLASEHVPVYMYHWALEADVVNGARHGDNIFYETRQKDKRAISESQDVLSGMMHAYITSFICKGDPNAIGGAFHARPKWKAYDVKNPKTMVFAEHNKELVGGTDGPPAILEEDSWAKVESDFWWSKVRVSQQ